MYPVTDDFKSAIYSNFRDVTGRVTFDISPVNIENDTPTVTTTSNFAISNSAQLYDNVRTQTRNLVTWETNRTKLDGSWTFPSDTSTDWGQVGWVSNQMSDENKVMNRSYWSSYPSGILHEPEPQAVSLTFNSTYTSSGVTVTFNPLDGEYATDFTISAYDSSNNQIYTTTIIGNTLTQYALQASIINFQKITVTISKWSAPYRHARVCEIDPGVVLVFEDDKLIRMHMTEEMDTISNSVAIPEFEFTVNNMDGTFAILNPSGIYASLQQRQRIQPELGLVMATRTEYVPLGTFYLSEWRSDVGSTSATFRGRSKIDLLDLTNFQQLTPQVGYDLGQLAASILSTAGVTGIYIDPALSAISTNGLVSAMTCREALQMVAIAACATIRITRGDVLRIETTRQSTYVNQISFEDIPSPSQIQQFKGVKVVSVNYFSDLTTLAGTSIVNSTYVNGETINVTSNTLINNSIRASAVASWIRDRRNERNLFTVDYRGNPALELNDLVNVENVYNTAQNMYMTKNELYYEGYLTGRIEGRTS